MAADVQNDIENALNQIASTVERSSIMKREVKQTIYLTVCNLRKLFVTLIDTQNSKNRTIAELEKSVACNKEGIELTKSRSLAEPPTPSSDTRPWTPKREVAPSRNSQEGQHSNTTDTEIVKLNTTTELPTPPSVTGETHQELQHRESLHLGSFKRNDRATSM
jgi:hypothetical protein